MQVILSVLQNAAIEARTGSVINVQISTEPLSDNQICDPGLMIAENINLLDFSMMLVCTVEFKHNQGYKQKLEELTL